MKRRGLRAFGIFVTICVSLFRVYDIFNEEKNDDIKLSPPPTQSEQVLTNGKSSYDTSQSQTNGQTSHSASTTTGLKANTGLKATVPFEQQAHTLFNDIGQWHFADVETFLNEELSKQTFTRDGNLYVNRVIKVAMNDYWDVPVEAQMMEAINTWINEFPESPWPYIIKSEYYYHLAWNIRGGSYVHKTPQESMDGYAEKLTLSVEALQRALEIDQSNPVTLLSTLRLGRQINMPKAEFEGYFQAAIEVVPSGQSAYSSKMHYLLPQWQGSAKETINFSRQAFRNAPRGTAIPFTLPSAHLQVCNFNKNCSTYLQKPKVWLEVEKACTYLMEDFPLAEEYRLKCAEIAEQADKVNVGYRWVQEGLKLAPDNPPLKARAHRLENNL